MFTKHSIRNSLVSNNVLRRFIFITTQETPNPTTVKFVTHGKSILPDDFEGEQDFRTLISARRAPLARNLLLVPGVSSVYLGKDYVAVTKKSQPQQPDNEEIRWSQLKPSVYAAMMEFFDDPKAVSVLPPLPEEAQKKAEVKQMEEETDSELVLMIKELLEEKVRPMAKDDGGDVIFKGFDEKEGVVSVQLLGSCVGCPSSTITLKNGVENMLRHYMPEVKRVDAVVGEIGKPDDAETHHLTFNNPGN